MTMRFHLRSLLIVLALGPPMLTVAQDKAAPGEALYGEWEVVEMVYRATNQDFGGGNGGWFIFDKEAVAVIPDPDADEKIRKLYRRIKSTKSGARHAITFGTNTLDIDFWWPWSKIARTTKAYYELRDGKLRIIMGEDGGERPTDFDEAYKNKGLTYYGLKKVK